MSMDLQRLHKERRVAFWGQVLPYLGYVIQSGLAVVFGFALIAFAAWYTSLLMHTPPDLPIRWIMLIVAIPIAHASFRTYLNAADIVFLRPQEHAMYQYFKASRIRGVVYKIFGLLLLSIIVWPLYIRSDAAPKPLLLTLLLFVLLKLLFSYGGWQELRMVSIGGSIGYRLLRWVLAVLMVAAWLWQPPLHSVPFIILVGVVYVLVLRFPVKLLVAWEKLIRTEGMQAARVMRTLGWFVDVPALTQRVTPRRWLSWLGGNIPWNRRGAYRYLLFKTFLRTEPAGIVIRLGILGLLIIYITHASWIGIAVYLFFIFLIGVQVTSLRQYHKDSLWLQLYPIPAHSRRASFLDFVIRLTLPAAVVLWLPFLAKGTEDLLSTLLTLLGGVAVVFLLRGTQAKKWRLDGQDEEEV